MPRSVPGTRGISFNGATSFQTWKYHTRDPGWVVLNGSFNGATSFQTWKLAPSSAFKKFVQSAAASMGPRLFRRGNEEEAMKSSERGNHASMGPRLFRRGNPMPPGAAVSEPGLQWGHVFSDVEMPHRLG